MGLDIHLICISEKQKYFCGGGWTSGRKRVYENHPTGKSHKPHQSGRVEAGDPAASGVDIWLTTAQYSIYTIKLKSMSKTDTPLEFIGTSRDDLSEFPAEVKYGIGFALRTAQRGGKHPDAKPLKGFKGASVLEIVSDFDGNTFRAVYTVKIKGVIYVLHAFQKKSKKGIATPKAELDKIKRRLKEAEQASLERER
jgi:phage-related protein